MMSTIPSTMRLGVRWLSTAKQTPAPQQFKYIQHLLVSSPANLPKSGWPATLADPYLASLQSSTAILSDLKITATSDSWPSLSFPSSPEVRNILVLPDNLLFRNVPQKQDAFDVFVRMLVETRLGVFDKTPLDSKDLQVERIEGTHLVVCTHGEKDCRCGFRGTSLFLALKAHLANRATSSKYYLHDSSHIGGHDYAANLIAYPAGDWYGNLAQSEANAVTDAKAIVDAIEGDTILWDKWRGRVDVDLPTQKRMLAAKKVLVGSSGCGSANPTAKGQGEDKKETIKVTYVLQNGQKIEVDAELSEFTPADPVNPYFKEPKAAPASASPSEISLSDTAYSKLESEEVSITFVFGKDENEERKEVRVKLGERLLEVAQAHQIPTIDGVCGGNMECATCHVIVDKAHFDALPKTSEGEEDMLEYALGRTDCSRLACQLKASKEMDGMELRVHTY
ncbi:hypothetical protein BC830DRAFT_1253927 [Chytriomyces sp. MP71]|nr:hypothetical protein BC830DRAFT_1253927 [Chytriomyces sp. MP71]